ncbi:histone-lysine N-methyltransferase set-1-like [Dendronephthya gigantea]|uniref:histone-lysine N-methyltransferase set-1-like n=1 Tax=Dendronephthya gigantea TaxID=151771 RepID=UPI00106D338A|nr:histone-lysine N-methyltransferase set-1-like [Dendronephthya gigantea]
MSDDQGMRSTRRNKRKGQFSLPKDEEHLEERYIDDDIGRGVFTTKTFSKGDFLLEYKGELISQEEGYIREKNYPDDLGSFLFFFQQGNASLWYVQANNVHPSTASTFRTAFHLRDFHTHYAIVDPCVKYNQNLEAFKFFCA